LTAEHVTWHFKDVVG